MVLSFQDDDAVCGGYLFESNFFSCLRIGKAGSYVDFYGDLRIDLDVFLHAALHIMETTDSKKCSFFNEFEFAFDLFITFSSLFVRLYLNVIVYCLNNFLCRAALADRTKLIDLILKHAKILLLKFWKFFHKFLDLFDQLNKSVCYKNQELKPKLGPHNFPQCTLPVSFH